MNDITRIPTFGIPVILGLGFAWLGNRIIRNEEELKNREQELQLQLNTKSNKALNKN